MEKNRTLKIFLSNFFIQIIFFQTVSQFPRETRLRYAPPKSNAFTLNSLTLSRERHPRYGDGVINQ
jgi:hypothetical protein